MLDEMACYDCPYHNICLIPSADHMNIFFSHFCRGGLAEILCKPKILPLKSTVLEQLQKVDQAKNDDEDVGFRK